MQFQVLKSCTNVMKMCVNAIRTQIELMQQMKSVYVWRMVQDNYDDMIVSLINQLPLMESSMDFSVKASSSANHETPALNGIFGQDPLPPLSRVFGGVRR